MRKLKFLALLLALILLVGCGGKQKAASETAPAESTKPSVGLEETAAPAQTEEDALPESAAAEELREETIPEEWISYEETPEEATRPVEVSEEQSIPELVMPTVSEEAVDPPSEEELAYENETPLLTP